MKFLEKTPIHPFLFSIYIVLHLYNENYNSLFFKNIATSLIIFPIFSIIIVIIMFMIVKNKNLAGLYSTFLIFFLVFYGYFFDLVYNLTDGVVPSWVTITLWSSLFLALAMIAHAWQKHLAIAAIFLNLWAVFLLSIPVVSLVIQVLDEENGQVVSASAADDQGTRTSPIRVTSGGEELPDIYYLVFDRYANQRSLADYLDYDNQDMMEFLRARGFYTLDDGRANYARTALSLASSLNLRHLTGLTDVIGADSANLKPLYALLQDNEVTRFLKAQGYRYLHFGSWWNPTRLNRHADLNFGGLLEVPLLGRPFNEFEWLLVDSMLPTRLLRLGTLMQTDRHQRQYRRVTDKFAKMAMLKRGEQPHFVFAHFLLPHDPYVFFPDGRFKSPAVQNANPWTRNYLDQLIYTNTQIQVLVDKLLAKEPKPIVIIQADEGPFFLRPGAVEKGFDWFEADDDDLKIKFGILHAVYFPDQDYGALYQDLTPVNSFRILFNQYFDQNLPLLPDRSFAYHSDFDLYSFKDITERLR